MLKIRTGKKIIAHSTIIHHTNSQKSQNNISKNWSRALKDSTLLYVVPEENVDRRMDEKMTPILATCNQSIFLYKVC